MLHFAIFGTHPRLSLAEFHALAPQTPTPRLASTAAIFDVNEWNGRDLMDELGGTTKLGDIFLTLPAEELDAEKIIGALPRQPRAAIDFGLTIFSGNPKSKIRFRKLPLELKKALKANGVSSRWVTGENRADISPAAVAKLHLTTDGLDFCVILDGETAHVGLTTHVQDADAWSLRDYGRPARSDVKGMLPPKLARILVNLAATPKDGTLLDPFCGSGTVLMEAALATDAKHIIGSDNDKDQIADTEKNTRWLIEKNILSKTDAARMTFFVADARKVSAHLNTKIDSVVSEGYLGPLLKGHESLATLQKNASDISALWKHTLVELKPLLAKNARLVCIWPAFKTTHGVARVDLDKDLAELGYVAVDPLTGWDASGAPLLYHRAGQFVQRRIAILKLK